VYPEGSFLTTKYSKKAQSSQSQYNIKMDFVFFVLIPFINFVDVTDVVKL